MIYKHVVNLPHFSAFSAIFREVFNKEKYGNISLHHTRATTDYVDKR